MSPLSIPSPARPLAKRGIARLVILCAAICMLGSGARVRGEARSASLPGEAAPQRVVSIGGAVTETIYALGEEARLVGVDSSSIYPEAATKLPQCGYQRMIAAEGVLSLRPDLVILAGSAGPEAAVVQIGQAGVETLRLEESHTLEGARERIVAIGKSLGREQAAEVLAKKIEEDAARRVPAGKTPPKVLFILSRGGGAVMLAGAKTAASAMIGLAGGINPAAATVEGYKPASGEAIMAFNPDVVVTTSRTFAELGEKGIAGLCPGIVLTGVGKQLVVMDDLYLLGFGPRTGEAVAELSRRIQPTPLPVVAGASKKD